MFKFQESYEKKNEFKHIFFIGHTINKKEILKKTLKKHGNQFSKKGCLKFQIYVNIKTWVGKN